MAPLTNDDKIVNKSKGINGSVDVKVPLVNFSLDKTTRMVLPDWLG